MARVQLNGISKRFDDTLAVDDVNLDIADHEFLVLLGPSGCGKSTILRLIAGLERPSAGEVAVGGLIVNDVAPAKRDVAMVFQSYALYPHKTVRQNIDVPLRSQKLPRDERAELVDGAATSLAITDLLDRKPAQLSGGQRQRVALARAIVRRPKVFLMDEPLSNLDATLRVQTRAELVDLHARLDATFIYVTHDQVEAMTMADRVAVIQEGRLQQVGPPAEVYDLPANTMVASFLGSPPMNLVAGEVHDERWLRLAGADDIVLPAGLEAAAAAAPGPAVRVGFRAEHVTIGTDGPLPATVQLVEALGYERLVHCETPAGERVAVRLGGDAPAPRENEAVRLAPIPERLHLFDPTTGERFM